MLILPTQDLRPSSAFRTGLYWVACPSLLAADCNCSQCIRIIPTVPSPAPMYRTCQIPPPANSEEDHWGLISAFMFKHVDPLRQFGSRYVGQSEDCRQPVLHNGMEHIGLLPLFPSVKVIDLFIHSLAFMSGYVI